MSSRLQAPVIGYTLGEQAGVGPELIARVLPGLPSAAEYRPMGKTVGCTPGHPTPQTARMALEHLERAAEALREGSIDAVVTAPVCKEALQAIGFPYPGQTEFFADRLGVRRHAMCLSGERLTVALCTTHVALSEVPALLSTERMVEVGELLCEFLQSMGHPHPRLAIAGLNPHNGESGAFGDEELRLIAPAVDTLRRRLPHATVAGPCVPDCVYREAAVEQAYDGIVAPYHDQALIPLKLLDFYTAVNTTLGLPRLRVSPDHGTAFALAGKGVANPDSMRHAFALALRSVGIPA